MMSSNYVCLSGLRETATRGISYNLVFTESHDFEDEPLKIDGFLEDICHMKNNKIVLSVLSFYIDESLFRRS